MEPPPLPERKRNPHKMLIGAVILVASIVYYIWVRPLFIDHNQVCDGAFDERLDHSQETSSHFNVKLNDACFGGWVQVPTWWPDWHVQPTGQDQSKNWISFWYENELHPIGPFHQNDRDFELHYGMKRLFRVRGHGEVIFYTSAPKRDNAPGAQKPATSETQAAMKPLGTLQVADGDSHHCDKPNDAEYYGTHAFSLPRFLFDDNHNDFSGSSRRINWGNGFQGTVPVCFVVDEKGLPTNIHLLQPLSDATLEKHIQDVVAGWRYQAAMVNGAPIKVQMLSNFMFGK